MIGIALSVFAAATFGLSVVLVRRSLSDSTVLSAALVVSCIGNVVFWPLALMLSHTTTIGSQSLLLFSIGGILAPGIARLLYYKGMKSVGVTVTSALFSTSPLYTATLAVILLGETLSSVNWIGIISIVAGVVCVQVISREQQPTKKHFMNSLALPIFAGLLVSCSQVMQKAGLSLSNEPLLGAAVGYASSLFFYLPLALLQHAKQAFSPRKDFKLFWKAGLIFAVGWLSAFYAFSHEKVAIAAPLIQIQPLFVTAFAYIYVRQQEKLSMRLVVSVVLVVSGAFLMGM